MTTGPIEIPGPWQHRYVAANGARFHVVEAQPAQGATPATATPAPDRPMVLLLHGFPEYWWAWRHQLAPLAEAGYHVVAMDLRGYGGSDKPPRGYDPMTLAGDVAGVIKALGATRATVIGHGWGGYVAWSAAAMHPQQVTAVCTVSAPHPLAMLRGLRTSPALAFRHILAMQVPVLPEQRLSVGSSGFLRRHLTSWSAPGSDFPDEESVTRYQEALGLWPAPHCALEYHRWLVRSRFRADGRRFSALMREPIGQPAYVVLGGADPALPPVAADRSERHVRGPFRRDVVDGAGHFVPEEAPDRLTTLLLDWLEGLAR